MEDVRVLVILQILLVGNTLCAVVFPTNQKISEGKKCTTVGGTDGICQNVASCDSAFLYFNIKKFQASGDSVCRQNAFYEVECCPTFVDFCRNIRNFHLYHGNETEPGMFPHLARLGMEVKKEVKWMCGGTIISEKHVLTAAHCNKPSPTIVGLGCVAVPECDQLISVKHFHAHKGYKKGKKYHDIALIELEASIQYNRRVLPVCPYKGVEDLPENEILTTVGFGETERMSQSEKAMYASVFTVKQEDCDRTMRNYNVMGLGLDQGVTAEMYCALGKRIGNTSDHPDTCQGDSGGPLQYALNDDVFVVGVVSTGLGCGGSAPGLYTRVASYIDWIQSTVNANSNTTQDNRKWGWK